MTVDQEITIDQGLAEDGSELAQRKTIKAYRAGRYVLIVAEGYLPSPGYDVDIEPNPIRIFPQQYNLLRRPRIGRWVQVVVPYTYSELVVFPTDAPVVTVHHADGQDQVEIEEAGDNLAEFRAAVAGGVARSASEVEATGFSNNLSFDEAFADALANLPEVEPTHSDPMTSVKVVETGGLFGGIAGFHHLYVNIVATRD